MHACVHGSIDHHSVCMDRRTLCLNGWTDEWKSVCMHNGSHIYIASIHPYISHHTGGSPEERPHHIEQWEVLPKGLVSDD